MPLAKDWDRHVDETDALTRRPGLRSMRQRLMARARPKPGDAVVDLGAGTGLLALGLAPAVDDLRAIDVSPAMTAYPATGPRRPSRRARRESRVC
jgi:ubiquinone/menaquinone biosynthesis C-methylase UbiE